jgi:hypothetical protein
MNDMVTDSFFTFVCAGFIALMFGTAVTFAGYRFFMLLLPALGFFFGLGLGAQTIQVLFGGGFLSTITSWVVGFVVGAIFAVLSYLFYMFAVGIIAGALGYAVSVSILLWIGLPMGIIVWLIGLVVSIATMFVTFRFNLQKYVVIVATSILGAATIFGTFILMFNPLTTLLQNPIRLFLQTSPFFMILFLIIAGLGIYVQVVSSQSIEVEAYNRLTQGVEP